MKQLSVVVITYNEHQKIRSCLQSVRWAGEIVVVDAMSTDGTVDLCREFTDRVYQRPWPGYGEQKNFGIRRATGEWVLILDADERVSPELQKEIQTLLSRDADESVAAYRIPRRNHILGRWVKQAGQYPDFQIRLFRRGKAWYNDKALHENLIVEGQTSNLKHALDHYSYSSTQDWLTKMNRYTGLMTEEQASEKKRVRTHDFFFRPLATFVKFYGFKRGYQEGVRGMIVATFASFFTFLKYAKLWERLYGK